MRTLLVEDDVGTATGMAMVLRSRGFVIDLAGDGAEALDMIRCYDYDLVLLDLVLPDLDGYEVIRRMRGARRDTPVLILSGLARPDAKVKGLGLGADDYVTKPCDTNELVARMSALIRRNRGFSESTLQVGPLKLNLDTREASVNGTPVHVTAKEYSILELLVLRKGVVQTKDAFLNHLYGGLDEPEPKIIDVFICKLRRKLQDAGAGGMIETSWGRGYILRAQPGGTAAFRGSDAGPEEPSSVPTAREIASPHPVSVESSAAA